MRTRDLREPTTSLPCAIILAAGLGRRMGCVPKAALQVAGESILEREVAALRGAGIDWISAVIGPYREQLLPLLARCRVQRIVHGAVEPSLVDSQRLALQSHQTQFPERDLLLVLGDLPLLRAFDVTALLMRWRQRDDHVQALVPVVDHVRGHPVLLSAAAVAQINGTPAHRGVRQWLREHPGAEQQILTTAAGYVCDIDTPADLAVLRASREG